MPKPEDQLVITLDWAAIPKGMGAIIWAVVNGVKYDVRHFIANVTEACSKRQSPHMMLSVCLEGLQNKISSLQKKVITSFVLQSLNSSHQH